MVTMAPIKDGIFATCDTLTEAREQMAEALKVLDDWGLSDAFRAYTLPMELGYKRPGYRVFIGRESGRP